MKQKRSTFLSNKAGDSEKQNQRTKRKVCLINSKVIDLNTSESKITLNIHGKHSS